MNKITAYLSLGSNIGDRLDYLDAAKEKLNNDPDIKIISQSKVYETEPWTTAGHPHAESGMDWFLNQVVKIQTSLKPLELLKALENIEKDLGRTAKGDLKPREIDIDILLYNDEVIDLPQLQIPHRHMNDRQFVLVPLVEISPDLKDPVTKNKYKYILENLEDKHKVIPFL